MYRIEFEPGDVGVFRSVEELATAIKSGVITPRARIYHQASDKWLPIEFHPHYRKALEMAASGTVSATPPAPRPAIHLSPEPVAVAPAPPAAAIEIAEPEPAAVEPEPVSPSEPPPEIFVPSRSREIRFIPLNDPAPRRLEPHVRVELPKAEIEIPAAPHETPDPFQAEPIQPEPELVVEPEVPISPANAPGGGAFYTPEESVRPAFGPRFRLSTRPSRPIALGIAGVALILSTHVGLSATGNLNVLSAGLSSLPFLRRDSGTRPDKSTAVAPTGTAAAPRAPEPQGSPSFGANSAFAPPSHGAPSAPAKREATVAPQRTPAPAEQIESASAATESIVSVAPQAIAVASAKIPGLAPAVNGKLTLPVLVTRYDAAYSAARAELETGIRTAGFGNVFAPEHMASSQGVRAARLSAGTAAAYVARYRRREAEIESAYADSAEGLLKSPADRRIWDSRQVRQESPETAKLAAFLLQEIDSVFGVLSSQDGAYEIKDGSITFQDAAAARAYAELRPWLDRRSHQWADTASGPPSTAAQVLRAIGATKLPEAAAF
jgi:hypothetical protein